jgi:anti-sigma-K factor RskA
MPGAVNTPPDNAALLQRLAAEYVLGTLRGPARRRMERWRATSPTLDGYCQFWEERLMPLLQDLKPERPPAHVWTGIEQRLGLAPRRPTRTPLRQFALAASVLLVLFLGALWLWRAYPPSRPTQAATISAPAGILWQVEFFARDGNPQQLQVRAGGIVRPPAGHDYELWALPANGKPVSLGVLPYRAQVAQRALTPVQQQAVLQAGKLAVSIEPPGGSPTGQPTGTVAFVVALRPVS